MKMPYKLPIIVRSKNGDWFVKYWHEYPDQPGVYKEFRARDGVNYVKDLTDKEKAIEELRADIEHALVNLNYNPFAQQQSVKKQIKEKIEFHENQGWTIEEGIRQFLKYCAWKKLSHNTVRTYQTFINNFEEWLNETGKLDTPASKFLEKDILDFLDTFGDAEDWEPRTYNNHIKFFVTLFNRIETEERKNDRELKYHINLSDMEFKVDKAEKNRAYSDIVLKRVKAELDKEPRFKNLRNFCEFIYLSCMRPKEIRLLKIQHIDMASKQIKVAGPTGKTGDRFVPISLELAELLNTLEFDKHPLHFQLFGRSGVPSDSLFTKCYFSKDFAIIKKRLDLDKNYTMYGLKHTRVIHLVKAGFPDEEIMKLTGHTNYQSFLAYKRDLVVDKTAMTGKTTGF